MALIWIKNAAPKADGITERIEQAGQFSHLVSEAVSAPLRTFSPEVLREHGFHQNRPR